MSEAARTPPFFAADFGEFGGMYEWVTFEEATAWLRQMRANWEWLARQNYNPCQQAWSAIAKTLTTTSQRLNQAQQYVSQGHPEHASGEISSAQSNLQNFIRSYPWLLQSTASYEFIAELSQSGKSLEAGLIVASWLNHDLSGAPVKNIADAMVTLALHERGIKDRARGEGLALRRLSAEMQTMLTAHKAEERAQETRFEELFNRIEEQAVAQNTAFEQQCTTRDGAWSDQHDAIKAELTGIKDAYDSHMALAAPVEYWENKRTKHKHWSIGVFAVLVVCMALVGFLLHTELQSIGETIAETRSLAKPTSNQPPAQGIIESVTTSAATWHLGSFVLLATLSFWFIRLLVRIFLSHLHLENDAAERVTMVKTYLAMVRDSALNTDDNISAVLAALFRPTGDGIVKDEGLPPTAMEWITKLGGKN